jgi:hypothetical protein
LVVTRGDFTFIQLIEITFKRAPIQCGSIIVEMSKVHLDDTVDSFAVLGEPDLDRGWRRPGRYGGRFDSISGQVDRHPPRRVTWKGRFVDAAIPTRRQSTGAYGEVFVVLDAVAYAGENGGVHAKIFGEGLRLLT